MPKARPARPDECRRQAIELLRAGRTPRELAESLGVSQQTPRNWRPQDQLAGHERDDGLTTDERDELRRLRIENARSDAAAESARQSEATVVAVGSSYMKAGMHA